MVWCHIQDTCWGQGFKLRSAYENLEDQAKSNRFKSDDSEAVFQTMETNLVNNPQRVRGDLSILNFNVIN